MKKADQAVVDAWKGRIAGDSRWAFRAALRMVELQTEEEQNVGATLDSNGVGLNAFDAEIVTSIVKQHERGFRLSRKQLNTLRRVMPKYAAQLFRISNEHRRNEEKAGG